MKTYPFDSLSVSLNCNCNPNYLIKNFNLNKDDARMFVLGTHQFLTSYFNKEYNMIGIISGTLSDDEQPGFNLISEQNNFSNLQKFIQKIPDILDYLLKSISLFQYDYTSSYAISLLMADNYPYMENLILNEKLNKTLPINTVSKTKLKI